MNWNLNRHINHFASLLAIGAVILLGSCSTDADMPDAPDNDACLLELYVNLGSGTATQSDDSRAATPQGDRFESGEGFENNIDMTDFRVYMFSMDNKLIRWLNPQNISEVTDKDEFALNQVDKDSPLYRLTFRVDHILENAAETPQSFKLVMLANWGNDYPSVAEGDAISKLVDNALGNFDPSATLTKIPFFGVQEYENVQFVNGEKVLHEESVQLLRAFAKIDVYDADDTQSTIKGVRLTRYNNAFYKAPNRVYSSTDYTGGTHYQYDTDYVTDLSIPENSEVASGVDLKTTYKDGHFIIYVPEYQNVGRADAVVEEGKEPVDNRAKLVVDYENGKEYVIDFKYYQNPPAGKEVNDPYDIRRNYWYKFIVKRNSADIEVNVDVLPYHAVELKPEFGI